MREARQSVHCRKTSGQVLARRLSFRACELSGYLKPISRFLSIAAAAAVLEGEQDEVAAAWGSFMKPLQPDS